MDAELELGGPGKANQEQQKAPEKKLGIQSWGDWVAGCWMAPITGVDNWR
jgi:hypothetical protein